MKKEEREIYERILDNLKSIEDKWINTMKCNMTCSNCLIMEECDGIDISIIKAKFKIKKALEDKDDNDKDKLEQIREILDD